MNIINIAVLGLAVAWRRPIVRILIIVALLLIIAVLTFPWWQPLLPEIETGAKAEREIVLDRSILQVTLIIAKPDTLRQMVEATGAELLSREITDGGFEAGRLMEILRTGDVDLHIKADMQITSPDPYVDAPYLPMKQNIDIEGGTIRVETYLEKPTSVLQGSKLVLLFTRGEGDQTILNASLEVDVSIRHLPFTQSIVDSQVAGTTRSQLNAQVDCLAKIVDESTKIPFSTFEGIGDRLRGLLNRPSESPEQD